MESRLTEPEFELGQPAQFTTLTMAQLKGAVRCDPEGWPISGDKTRIYAAG